MYRRTKFILKLAVLSANVGVRQGTPMSCLLFIFYAGIIRKIFGPGGFIGYLHCLMLMDDSHRHLKGNLCEESEPGV